MVSITLTDRSGNPITDFNDTDIFEFYLEVDEGTTLGESCGAAGRVEYERAVCSFYDIQQSKWSTEGCVTLSPEPETVWLQGENKTVIHCRCNHLTDFAALRARTVEKDGCNMQLLPAFITLTVIYFSLLAHTSYKLYLECRQYQRASSKERMDLRAKLLTLALVAMTLFLQTLHCFRFSLPKSGALGSPISDALLSALPYLAMFFLFSRYAVNLS